jgi:hypothetical protein
MEASFEAFSCTAIVNTATVLEALALTRVRRKYCALMTLVRLTKLRHPFIPREVLNKPPQICTARKIETKL